MAKRRARRTVGRANNRKSSAKKGGRRSLSAKRRKPAGRGKSAKRAIARKRNRPARPMAPPAAAAKTAARVAPKAPRLERTRRVLEEEVVPTPPSSLNLNRHGSAVRSGRAGMFDQRSKRGGGMNSVTAGDVDVSAEDAYFAGEEAPGGDNPTPDQDIVDDIGKALGVPYQDDEELHSEDKLTERDKHRWELDPASSEDYKERR